MRLTLKVVSHPRHNKSKKESEMSYSQYKLSSYGQYKSDDILLFPLTREGSR